MTDETAAPTPHPEGQPQDFEYWRICIDAPTTLTDQQRDDLSTAVIDAAHGWEQRQPFERTWDLFLYAGPASTEFGTDPHRPVSQGTEDSDYREQIARVVESHTPHDRVSEWQDINNTVTAVLAVMHPDTAEAARLRTDLTLAAAEAEDARDGGLDLAQELAEVRESRDQYHKNWDAAVAANMTALDTIGGLRADLETRTCERAEARQELAGEKHVRRLNEHGLLGQLAALRSTAVVLPEDWCEQVAAKFGYGPRRDGELSPRALDVAELIESWRAAPVLPVTPARPIDMVYLLDQYDRLLSAVEHIRMDTPEDRDRHARLISTFRRAAEPVRERVEGAAPPEVEITDEHVREHDDAAPTRDEVAEEWADTWDGVDRTPEWVRVVEPCPVPDCAIPQVHGHEGYGLRFTPAAQPKPQGEPDEDWCGRFADDGKHYCPEGHNTVYQMFSGGREWSCADRAESFRRWNRSEAGE